ncbi:hypothetical protein EDC04DRAFT_2608167 [Pisolithus marmoratus]|nr:hypothetical protein EDC04DRAFT_2608167 [Pisolithus marmoratus]
MVRGGIKIGGHAMGSCLKWMNRKVLEHAWFQGTLGDVLDVLTGVASEFFLSPGQMLWFLCDKQQTNATWYILPAYDIGNYLAALFESGITWIQDVKWYIKDDIMSTDCPDNDAIYNSDQEEEDILVMGMFTDMFGEDFLGLCDLGIAAELGLLSLGVLRKLLKGKRDAMGGVKAKLTEVLPPYPSPLPFLPIASKNVKDQIDLLHPHYHQCLSSLANATPVSEELPNASLLGVLPLPPLPPPPPSFPFLPLPGGVTDQGGPDWVCATGILATTVLLSEVVDGGAGVAEVDVGVVAGGNEVTSGSVNVNVTRGCALLKKERMVDMPPVIVARG